MKHERELVGRKAWDLGLVFINPLLPPIRKKSFRVLLCGSCGSKELMFKDYTVFEHPLHANQGEFRMDIAVKCRECGHVQNYGVHITEEEYSRITTDLRYLSKTDRRVTYKGVLKVTGMHININTIRLYEIMDVIKRESERMMKLREASKL